MAKTFVKFCHTVIYAIDCTIRSKVFHDKDIVQTQSSRHDIG